MYGENSADLRHSLADLLRQHRIQHRIGGPGMHSVPVSTSVAEREDIGQLIRTYRHGILTWTRQALDSATAENQSRTDPAVTLRGRLVRTMQASGERLPTLDELTTPHSFELVESWRAAAKAATLGEHDLTGELAPGSLDLDQRTALARDAADIIQGVLVLDQRYANIPGWQPLRRTVSLGQAADACAFTDNATIDRRGWRPPPATIDGPVMAGIGAVVQAQHNLLVNLRALPNALNLRRVLLSQQEVSRHLAALSRDTAPDFADACQARATTYQLLGREARNIGGVLGHGGPAAAEAANSLNRVQKLDRSAPISDRACRDLARLFGGIDVAVGAHIKHGAGDGIYLARVKVPRIMTTSDGHMVKGVRERFVPLTASNHGELVRLAGERLRPTSTPEPPAHDGGRDAYRAAINHQPSSRGIEL